MGGSKILRCICKYPYQDARYGKQRRVHTIAVKKSDALSTTYRCTVCTREQRLSR